MSDHLGQQMAAILRVVGMPTDHADVPNKLLPLCSAAAYLIAEDLIAGGKDVHDGSARMGEFVRSQVAWLIVTLEPQIRAALEAQHKT